MPTKRSTIVSKRSKPRKPPSVSKLKKEADRLFSLYVRQKDIDHDGNTKCVTCGKVAHWKNLQAGHYISRNHLSTRWEELNVFPQCVGCNIWGRGKHDEYAIYLIEKYGNNILELLHKQKQQITRMKRADYEALIEKYSH